MAFEVLAHPDTHGDPAVRCELVSALAEAAGAAGMVGGQMIDLIAEKQPLDIGAITRLQRLKTGALIAFSCEAGAILGKAPHDQRTALRGYAHDLGLAFQIADDLLDVEGTADETGKPVGEDAAAGKATFVSILGVERARAQADLLASRPSPILICSSKERNFCDRRRNSSLAAELEERKRGSKLQYPAFRTGRRCSTRSRSRPTCVSSPEADLRQVADELRAELIDAVSVTGGHLGAGLGVVELTVALHYVFNTPDDRLIWDVGHQAYPHKILTGRRDRIRTLRQGGGLSGFTKRTESEYDPFGAAHSSTSISAGLGMAVARDLKGEQHNVIAVIGDGAMSAGMAYEAMNNAGAMRSAADRHPQRQRHVDRTAGRRDERLSVAAALVAILPLAAPSRRRSRALPAEAARDRRAPGRGAGARLRHRRHPVRGDGLLLCRPDRRPQLDHLLPVLKNVRDSKESGPVLIHVVTEKGHGYLPAEQSDDK